MALARLSKRRFNGRLATPVVADCSAQVAVLIVFIVQVFDKFYADRCSS
jgi:hypothetical protein